MNYFGWAAALAAALCASSALAQQRVTDNENVTNKTTTASVSTKDSKSKKIDLNSASKEELQTVPGIDAGTADAIIAARPLKSAGDLRRIQGVEAEELSQMLSHVRVSRDNTAVGGPAAASTGQASGREKPSAEAHSKASGKKSDAGIGAEVKTDSTRAGSDKPGAKEKEKSKAPKEKDASKSGSDQKY